MLIVKNAMEPLVWQMLNLILGKFPEACDCDICRCDIAAITLNQLQPKYYATEKGEIYNKVKILELQYRADIVGAITKAIIRVSKNPRCGKKKSCS